MAFLPGLFANPAEESQKYLNQVPGAIKPYYEPYTQAGNQAVGQYGTEANALTGMRPELTNQLSKLMQNPGNVYNELGQGYQQSPGFQFALQQALGAINNANAAGGNTGTPAHQFQAGKLASDFASQDFEKYLDHVIGLMGTGLQGESKLYGAGYQGLGNLTNLGYNANSDLAGNIATSLTSQANNAYAARANQNSTNQGLFGSLLGLGASAAPAIGGMLFGPPGAAAGGVASGFFDSGQDQFGGLF